MFAGSFTCFRKKLQQIISQHRRKKNEYKSYLFPAWPIQKLVPEALVFHFYFFVLSLEKKERIFLEKQRKVKSEKDVISSQTKNKLFFAFLFFFMQWHEKINCCGRRKITKMNAFFLSSLFSLSHKLSVAEKSRKNALQSAFIFAVESRSFIINTCQCNFLWKFIVFSMALKWTFHVFHEATSGMNVLSSSWINRRKKKQNASVEI